MATIAAIVTDAFCGFGGIAQYNRDFLTAIADSPLVERVTVLPRVMEDVVEEIPPAINNQTDGLGGLKRYVRAATAAVFREPPNLIVCGHVNLLPIAVPLATLLGVPVALLVYGIDVWHRPRPVSQLLLGRVNHLISISQLTVDKMANWSELPSRCPTTIIPNAIDLTRFQQCQRKPQELLDRYNLHGKRVIMTLARLVARERYKGVREVLDLMPELLGDDPNLVYLVVGDGSDLPDLRQHASNVGVQEHVVFAGRIEETEKVPHYQVADAYVMPGRGEGFGFVFLEAMACGLPVVASILDGSREAVRYGALGHLCDPRDPSSTRAAINSALAKGRGKPPDGLDYFSVPNFRKRVHEFLEQCLR